MEKYINQFSLAKTTMVSMQNSRFYPQNQFCKAQSVIFLREARGPKRRVRREKKIGMFRVSPKSLSPFLPSFQTFPFTAPATCVFKLGINTECFAVYNDLSLTSLSRIETGAIIEVGGGSIEIAMCAIYRTNCATLNVTNSCENPQICTALCDRPSCDFI